MNYDLLNIIVAILSLILAIYTTFKTNSSISIQNRVTNYQITNIYVNRSTTDRPKPSNNSDDIVKLFIEAVVFIFLMYLYFTYMTISYFILNLLNFSCILCFFISSKKNTNIEYARYINIELMTLAFIAILINVSQLHYFVPDSFNINAFTSEKMNWSTLSGIINSGLSISVDSIIYLCQKAPFEIQTFFISRTCFIFFSVAYIIGRFTDVLKMKSKRLKPAKMKNQIIGNIFLNLIFIFLILNALKTVVPHIMAVL